MGIQGMGIGLYGQGYSYNPMDRMNQKSANLASTIEEPEKKVQALTSVDKVTEPEQAVQKAPKILAKGQLEDFAFDFKKGKEFSMVGEDSSLASLDKASNLPDTKKDELLDQYKFFVDSTNDPVQYASEEGSVRRVLR